MLFYQHNSTIMTSSLDWCFCFNTLTDREEGGGGGGTPI